MRSIKRICKLMQLKIQEYLASGMAGSRDLNHVPGSSLYPNLLIPLPISWYHVHTVCHGGRRATATQAHILSG